jgi:HD-like signal output (HDOD) protein
MSNPAFSFVRQLGEDLAKGEFDLPPFPDTALRVQRCVRDPDSSIQDLAAIVASEPALAARLMRMANSALVRRGPIEVTDINTAISRVGQDMVQNVAVSFAAREAFKCPPGAACADDLNALRQRSVKVAAFSYVVASHSRFQGKPDEAMLAGLLHSVGKLYIIMKASDHPELFTDRNALDTLVAQWHTGVARAIVDSWDFPESIAVGVDEQELVERDRIVQADLSDILFVSNMIVDEGPENAGEFGDLDALKRLRISAEDLATLLSENAEEIQSTIEALSS